jgi:hypothetical protein
MEFFCLAAFLGYESFKEFKGMSQNDLRRRH